MVEVAKIAALPLTTVERLAFPRTSSKVFRGYASNRRRSRQEKLINVSGKASLTALAGGKRQLPF